MAGDSELAEAVSAMLEGAGAERVGLLLTGVELAPSEDAVVPFAQAPAAVQEGVAALVRDPMLLVDAGALLPSRRFRRGAVYTAEGFGTYDLGSGEVAYLPYRAIADWLVLHAVSRRVHLAKPDPFVAYEPPALSLGVVRLTLGPLADFAAAANFGKALVGRQLPLVAGVQLALPPTHDVFVGNPTGIALQWVFFSFWRGLVTEALRAGTRTPPERLVQLLDGVMDAAQRYEARAARRHLDLRTGAWAAAVAASLVVGALAVDAPQPGWLGLAALAATIVCTIGTIVSLATDARRYYSRVLEPELAASLGPLDEQERDDLRTLLQMNGWVIVDRLADLRSRETRTPRTP